MRDFLRIFSKGRNRMRGCMMCLFLLPGIAAAQDTEWRLVWSEEFNTDGRPDTTVWNYETGFVRNKEDQWYQDGNAVCRDGKLVIEARKVEEGTQKNPGYTPGSDDWRSNREYIRYTSSSINTAGKFEFLYGRMEVRARIPISSGAWPAIWLKGRGMPWPSCGEIDVMEYYRIDGIPHILANACWGTDQKWVAKWRSRAVPFTHFTDRDPQWADKFHIWRMDWDETSIRLYLDDELLNEIPLSETVNGSVGEGINPFKRPQFILLNLALSDVRSGEIDDSAFPVVYEVDYVRVYQPVQATGDNE